MLRFFAHRGYHNQSIAQNSIASLKEAYELNFRAVEYDVWFLEGKIYVVHDRPESNELESLPQLSDYFLFKNEMKYWIDFKNLDQDNCEEAFLLTKKTIFDAKINLENIYLAPYITDYKISKSLLTKARKIFGKDINYIALCDSLTGERNLLELKDFITENQIKHLSIFYKLITKDLVKEFLDIELFSWTIKDVQTVVELEELGIKNFATDKITPQDYENYKKNQT